MPVHFVKTSTQHSRRAGHVRAVVTLLLAAGWTLGCIAAPAAARSGAAPAHRGPAEIVHAPLLGYPEVLGVQLVHDGSAPSGARQYAATAAEARAGVASHRGLAAERPAVRRSDATAAPTPACPSTESALGQDLCWWGGPVIKTQVVHLVFWEGTEGNTFSPEYVAAIERYFDGVSEASGRPSNVYGVAAQYGDAGGPGEYVVEFNPAEDVYQDHEHALPAAGEGFGQCIDTAVETEARTEREPCVTNADVKPELVAAQNTEHALEGWDFSLENVYFVFTPHNVGGCIFGHGEGSGAENGCAMAPGGYCGYHSYINVHVPPPPGEVRPAIFAVIPEARSVAGCQTGEQPNGEGEGGDGPIDSTLATISHEHQDLMTDPEGHSWHDIVGEEAVDKCEQPYAFEDTYGLPTAVFGGPIGGTPPKQVIETTEGHSVVTGAQPGTLYNEVIEGGDYLLPTVWSNAATFGGGRCVQRLIPAAFAVVGAASAGAPTTLSASASGEPGDPVDYWVWTFGDAGSGHLENQVGTGEPTISHTYAAAGSYVVALTVYDAYGNSNTTDAQVVVGPGHASSTTTTTTTVTTPVALAHYSSAQVATVLGLARGHSSLAALGTITLGHTQCPPACSVTGGLYASVTSGNKGHRKTASVLVGAVTERSSVGGAQPLIVASLNAEGVRLLRRHRSIAATLRLTVTDIEGGTWPVVRRYTLTIAPRGATGGQAARARLRSVAHRRSHPAARYEVP
jgi:hypothetical protein